jgi:putative tryptophan/tyrosine transport system substrate-binding protein
MATMRRLTLLLVSITLVLTPLTAAAQPRVGVLLFGNPATDPNFASFRAGLTDLGYVEGRNIYFEVRAAEGKPERLPDLARELVALKPNVIYALGGDVAPSIKAVTATIPVVVTVSLDPVQAGLVGGLARPGGNITGVTLVSSDLAAKRLQFLKETAPAISRVGVLWNPMHPDFEYKETLVAGQRLGVSVQSLEVGNLGDFEAAFKAAAAGRAEAVIVASSRQMTLHRKQIMDLAARHRILLVSGWGQWAEAGALLSYGPDLNAIIRSSASHVDKILKGAKPGELPFEQPTKFELVINLRTARAFGLTIPQSLAVRADKVIE